MLGDPLQRMHEGGCVRCAGCGDARVDDEDETGIADRERKLAKLDAGQDTLNARRTTVQRQPRCASGPCSPDARRSVRRLARNNVGRRASQRAAAAHGETHIGEPDRPQAQRRLGQQRDRLLD